MRYFNTFGTNTIEEHYTQMRPHLIAKALEKIRNEQYLTICSPPLTGKSTFFNLMTIRLREENYKVAYISFKGFENATKEALLTEFHIRLYQGWALSFKIDSISSVFNDMMKINNMKLVLIIDDVDGFNPLFLESLLLSIRVAFHSRSEHALKSVILGSVSHVLSLAKDMKGSFNIADNFDLPYFSNEETLALLAQHEIETGQLFDPSVKTKISDITANQPGLVSGLAAKLVGNNPLKPILTYADYLLVEQQYLIELINNDPTHIIEKAKNYRSFIERMLFADSHEQFQILREHIRELFFYGIIDCADNGVVKFRAPLYEKCLHQAFSPSVISELKRLQKEIDTSAYFTTEGLSMSKGVDMYKKYIKKNGFDSFIVRDKNRKALSIENAALIYSFETYINAFLSLVDGTAYIEAQPNLGRTFIRIRINGQDTVIAAKVYRNSVQFNEGKKQVAQYAYQTGLTTATYLVFVSSEVTHPEIVEKIETFQEGNVVVSTYLIRYDLATDF